MEWFSVNIHFFSFFFIESYIHPLMHKITMRGFPHLFMGVCICVSHYIMYMFKCIYVSVCMCACVGVCVCVCVCVCVFATHIYLWQLYQSCIILTFLVQTYPENMAKKVLLFIKVRIDP